MNELAAAFAKLAGTRMALGALLTGTGRPGLPQQNFPLESAQRYFESAVKQLEVLRTTLPLLYEDFALQSPMPALEVGSHPNEEWRYERSQLIQLARDVDEIFEIRSNSELVPLTPQPVSRRRVFISHGRAPVWREVQAFIEKDLSLPTVELAQEPNQGRTVLTKLSEVSDQCDSAVIVMTGDDMDSSGQVRA